MHDSPGGMRLLVTGAAGFIGTNFVRHALARPDGVERLVAIDLLTYAGNRANLAGLEADPRFRFVRLDVAERAPVAVLVAEERIDAVVHFAAETHVDRSIRDVAPFLRTNVEGTLALLGAVRGREGFACFLHVSTGEVYGAIAEGRAREDSPQRQKAGVQCPCSRSPKAVMRCASRASWSAIFSAVMGRPAWARMPRITMPSTSPRLPSMHALYARRGERIKRSGSRAPPSKMVAKSTFSCAW